MGHRPTFTFDFDRVCAPARACNIRVTRVNKSDEAVESGDGAAEKRENCFSDPVFQYYITIFPVCQPTARQCPSPARSASPRTPETGAVFPLSVCPAHPALNRAKSVPRRRKDSGAPEKSVFERRSDADEDSAPAGQGQHLHRLEREGVRLHHQRLAKHAAGMDDEMRRFFPDDPLFP